MRNHGHWLIFVLALVFVQLLLIAESVQAKTPMRDLKIDSRILCQGIDADKWIKSSNAGYEAEKKGQLKEAENHYIQSLEEAEKFNNSDVQYAINTLANFYKERGLYDKARSLYEKSLRLTIKQNLKPDKVELKQRLDNLGLINKLLKNYDVSSQYYKQSLEILKSTGSYEKAEAMALNNLGEVYKQQGNYKAAESLYKDAITILKHAGIANGLDTALLYNNLAELYKTLDKNSESEMYYKQSLQLWQNNGAVIAAASSFYGIQPHSQPLKKEVYQNYPDLVTTLDGYAELLRKLNRPEQAHRFEIRSKALKDRKN